MLARQPFNISFTPDKIVNEFNKRFTVKNWCDLLQKLGWKPDKLESRFPSFTRQGKDKGVSGELLTDKEIILLHNFSSNSNLPVKRNGKSTYSPAEIVTDCFFNGNWKESFKYFCQVTGLNPDKNSLPGCINHSVPLKSERPLINKVKDIDFKEDPDLLFRTNVINGKKERVFRIAVNKSILNKNLNPETGNPYRYFDYKLNQYKDSFYNLTSDFRNSVLSLSEIADVIGKGQSICCSVLKEDEQGKTKRVKGNWLSSELIGIDIDNTVEIEDGNGCKIKVKDEKNYLSLEEALKMPETRFALLIYTTTNHTQEINRFRILFSLPRHIKDKDVYENLLKRFINAYKADQQCKDPVRAFYGNSDSTIYVIKTGEVLQFKDGKLLITNPDQDSDEILNKGEPAKAPALNSLQDNKSLQWFEVHYLNGKIRYSRAENIETLLTLYKRAGIFVKEAKPVIFKDQRISYIN